MAEIPTWKSINYSPSFLGTIVDSTDNNALGNFYLDPKNPTDKRFVIYSYNWAGDTGAGRKILAENGFPDIRGLPKLNTLDAIKNIIYPLIKRNNPLLEDADVAQKFSELTGKLLRAYASYKRVQPTNTAVPTATVLEPNTNISSYKTKFTQEGEVSLTNTLQTLANTIPAIVGELAKQFGELAAQRKQIELDKILRQLKEFRPFKENFEYFDVSATGELIYNRSQDIYALIKNEIYLDKTSVLSVHTDAVPAELQALRDDDKSLYLLAQKLYINDPGRADLWLRKQAIWKSFVAQANQRDQFVKVINTHLSRISAFQQRIMAIGNEFSTPPPRPVRSFFGPARVDVRPEGAKKPGFFSRLFGARGGGRRRTLKRRATVRATKSRSLRSRSRRRSNGNRAGTRRRR